MSKTTTWCYAPPVLDNLFSLMPAKQLNLCAQVCKAWKSATQHVKRQRRNKLVTHIHVRPDGVYENPEELFKDFVNNMYIEPKFMMMFCTTEDSWFWHLNYTVTDTSERSANHESSEMVGPLFLKYLPQSCDVGICTTSKLTAVAPYSEITEDLQPSHDITAVLCFSCLEGVELYRFEISNIPLNTSFTDANFYRYTGIPADSQIKCLLLFSSKAICTPASAAMFDKLLNYFVDKTNGHIAIGGTFINSMGFPKHEPMSRNPSYGIAFTGENVEAASVAIDQIGDYIIHQLETDFSSLSETPFARGQSTAFLFTTRICKVIPSFEGKFEDFGKECVKVFRKFFPSVPLFSLPSNVAGVGTDYLPNKNLPYLTGLGPFLLVFVIISIKKSS